MPAFEKLERRGFFGASNKCIILECDLVPCAGSSAEAKMTGCLHECSREKHYRDEKVIGIATLTVYNKARCWWRRKGRLGINERDVIR